MSVNKIAALRNAPRQRRSEQSLQRILKASESILRRDGIEALKIRAVAKRANVSLGGIYRRFVDRNELVSAVHAKILKELEARVITALHGTRWASLSDL